MQHAPGLRDVTVPNLVQTTSSEAGQGPWPLPQGIVGTWTIIAPFLHRTPNPTKTLELRARRGTLGPRDRLVFRGEEVTKVDEDVSINIRHVFSLSRMGPEPMRDLNLDLGNVVGGEYVPYPIKSPEPQRARASPSATSRR